MATLVLGGVALRDSGLSDERRQQAGRTGLSSSDEDEGKEDGRLQVAEGSAERPALVSPESVGAGCWVGGTKNSAKGVPGCGWP